MPVDRLAQFKDNTVRARDLVGLGQSIGGLTHGRVDSSDLFRAALVQTVAALDAYIHGVVLDRAVDMLVGHLQVSGVSTKVGLTFVAVQSILTAGSPVQVELTARSFVAQRLALETFQRSDDIAQGLAMVGVRKIWVTAFGNGANATKTALGVIVARRNRIVHSCDVDPLNPATATPLTDADALDAIDTIEQIVAQIDPLCGSR